MVVVEDTRFTPFELAFDLALRTAYVKLRFISTAT